MRSERAFYEDGDGGGTFGKPDWGDSRKMVIFCRIRGRRDYSEGLI